MSSTRYIDGPVNLNVFLSTHAVFTVDELDRFMATHGSTNKNTRKALLTYHRSKGRVVLVRRGLYATVPVGGDPHTHPIDPFLVAAKMAEDAVLAYHTALEFHGKAYSSYSRLVYTSESRTQTTHFRSHEYARVPVPHSLVTSHKAMVSVATHKRAGVAVHVTNLERTLVDVLNRPDLSGSWEEIWRSLESIEFFDMDQVIDYVGLLGNATTAAKVGFFLDQHRESLMVADDTLESLRELVPKQPHYLNRGYRKRCRLISTWNLLAPAEILNRSWEEVL
jgi:predicted transcriptional regulator of viral defense system